MVFRKRPPLHSGRPSHTLLGGELAAHVLTSHKGGPPMKRRDFLKRTAAVASVLASGATPTILRATDKAGAKNPILGTGEHKYECLHDWGKLPASVAWQTTHGVAIDAEGLIYITHQGAGKDVMDTVVVFDPKGKYVRSFGKQWHGGGHGIDIRKEGTEQFLYLSHMTHKGPVVKTTLKGEVVWKKETPLEPGVYQEKSPFRPTNVAFAPDGGFYVGDGYGSHYIHQYDKDARWVRTWGGAGKEPGKMQTPHGLWLDDRPGRQPSLVVADRANARLQYFTLDGKHLGFIHEVLFPAHFDIRGEVLLVPDLHARVSLFDRDNKVIAHLGYDPEWTKKALANKFRLRTQPAEWLPGKLVHRRGACFDRDGNIFVVEWVATGRVTLLKRIS